MKIGIIGAGFTALSAGYYLSQKGHQVAIFEKDKTPGGLAIGFKEKKWQWSLESHYHHWFTNDDSILDVAKRLNYNVIIKRPKTSIYLNDNFYQLDSPFNLLKLNELSFFERFRMGFVLGILRYNPFWKNLEGINAENFLSKSMGKKAFEKVWKSQLYNKFGRYAKDISLAWFWARIKKRTSSLAYPQEGFFSFAKKLVEQIENRNGNFMFNTEVKKIQKNGEKISICFNDLNSQSALQKLDFDKVIVTLPSFLFMKITPTLPEKYVQNLKKLKGLGAINLVLRLKKQFLKNGTYWLSVCDINSPVMAVVEHTNFMDKKYYNNEHIVYLGNYKEVNHEYFKMSKEELLKTFDSFLKKINPGYKREIIDYHLFKSPFAQPIVPINYSKIVPPFETPIKNVYLANIQQVYPWDRGTNYAVELGKDVAKMIG